MSSQSKKVKNQILASKISVIRSLNNEQALKYELTLFFQNLKKSVLSELEEFYSEEFMFQAHADLILAPIFEAQQEYYNILRKFNHKEYKFGRKTGRRLVKLARKKAKKGSLTYADKASKTPSILNATIKKDELFDTNPWSEQKLLNQTFTASERTMNRIDSDINKILSDGYRNGKGINVVRNDITKRFDQLSSWEATRIARTEIHNAHNMGTMAIYQEMGVEYIQWISSHDRRTRRTHRKINGEIIPIGGTYSNDLRYPGDTSGPIEEWINCRCSNAPFIIPDGYIAPSFAPFKEKDLISTLDYWNQDELMSKVTNSTQLEIKHTKNISNTFDQFQKPKKKSLLKRKIKSPFKKLFNNNSNSYSSSQEIILNSKQFNDVKITQKHDFMTIEDAKKLYDSLKPVLKFNIDEIQICPTVLNENGKPIQGRVKSGSRVLELLFDPHCSIDDYKSVMYHEAAHILDHAIFGEPYGLSSSKMWGDVFILDNQHNIFIHPETGEQYIRNVFPTKYAKDKANEHLRNGELKRFFAEDFAESVRLYLNKDARFMNRYPNRYNLLKKIIGEP